MEERCQGVEYKPKSEKGDRFECAKDIGVEVKGYKELPGTGAEIQGDWAKENPERRETVCVCVWWQGDCVVTKGSLNFSGESEGPGGARETRLVLKGNLKDTEQF